MMVLKDPSEMADKTDLDCEKLNRLRVCAAAAVAEHKRNLHVRHIIWMGDKPLGLRAWMLSYHETIVYQIPPDAIHALLTAYGAFENYSLKPLPNHVSAELRDGLLWLRAQRHGPKDHTRTGPGLDDINEFCWFCETVFDLCPKLAFRYHRKREMNVLSMLKN